MLEFHSLFLEFLFPCQGHYDDLFAPKLIFHDNHFLPLRFHCFKFLLDLLSSSVDFDVCIGSFKWLAGSFHDGFFFVFSLGILLFFILLFEPPDTIYFLLCGR